jgi:tetratricopeptide (TPR) repeat protein
MTAMKKIVAGVFFLGSFFLAIAQNNSIDSFQKLLKDPAVAEEERLMLMGKLAELYARVDIQKGLGIAREAMALSQKTGSLKGMAAAYLGYGTDLNYAGSYRHSIDTLHLALHIFEKVGDSGLVARTLNILGFSYYQTDSMDLAFACHFRGLHIAERIHDDDLLGNLCKNIGNDYGTLANVALSTDYYQRAMTAFERAGNINGVASINGNFGNRYINAQQPARAVGFLKKALDGFEQVGNKLGVALALHNLGAAYKTIAVADRDPKNYDTALYYIKRSLEINQQIGSVGNSMNDMDNLGQVYNETGNYDSSIYYMKRSLPFVVQQRIPVGIARELRYLADDIVRGSDAVLRKNGFDPHERFVTALSYQRQAVSEALKVSEFGEQTLSWSELSQLYSMTHQYDSALYAYKKFHTANDSFYNIQKAQALTKLTMQYDFDKHDYSLRSEDLKKQAIAKEEISRQRTVRNASILVGLFIVLSGIATFIFYKKRNDERFRARVAETEMKALRAQMNPHFLFNSLNSIGDFILQNDLVSARSYLAKFAGLVRAVLESSEQKLVPLAEDLHMLELYLELERLRFENKFSYEIRVDPAIDKENFLVPPLILQPLVENSVKHGMSRGRSDGMIRVTIQKQDDMINCIVEDNGLRPDPVIPATRRSLGLSITRSRIAILNKTTRNKGTIELFYQQGGTRATVQLPIQPAF